mgnify:FL=1
MAHYLFVKWYTVVRRHYILVVLRILKFIFLLTLAVFLYVISSEIINNYPDLYYMKFIFFLFVFWTLNYAFLSLILSIIEYYFDLMIVYKDQIVSIKCSLLFRDDIEIIDAYRIMKVDGYSRGLMQNIFWFWNLIIEQQKDDSKVYHFMPKPYRILLIIQKQRDNLLADRKKKYIVPEEDIQQEKKKKA